ncbi:uncharacterized protein OCT59_027480 [Rhizophagus irregularis]|uniref:uncharacterized protein n=1 Tax=Rhizophagus irregularis TaxID=588596 RepID=UPI003328E0E8|nr:hypothetical protein OCT59_027480 [Rhizophagus irregularis]
MWPDFCWQVAQIKKKNKSKEYTISLQLRTDGEYSADTDDDKNPESSQNHKRKRRHVANEDYEINDYRTDTDDDENPESESYSQNHVANEAVDFEKYLLLNKPLWNTFSNAGTSH